MHVVYICELAWCNVTDLQTFVGRLLKKISDPQPVIYHSVLHVLFQLQPRTQGLISARRLTPTQLILLEHKVLS